MADGDASALVPEGHLAGMSFVGAELDGRRLAGISFRECTLQDVSVDGADLRAAGFVDVAIERLNAPVFSAPRSQFRRVVVDGSRFGSAEVYESEWESVEIRNCKLGYVNLRGAELQDVLFYRLHPGRTGSRRCYRPPVGLRRQPGAAAGPDRRRS